jgi:chorismate-pyruvate lyase
VPRAREWTAAGESEEPLRQQIVQRVPHFPACRSSIRHRAKPLIKIAVADE